MSGKSIEAVLRLETTPFVEALTKTKNEVNNFRNSLLRMGRDSPKIEQGIFNIQKALSILIPYLKRFANITSETKAFSQFTRGLKQMSEAVMNLSNVTKSSQVGMIRIKEIIREWSNAVRNLTVSVRESTNAERQQVSTLNQLRQAYAGGLASQEAYKNHLTSMNNSTRVGRQNLALYNQNLRQLAMGVEQFNAIETNGISKNNSYASSLERTGASARRTATQMSSLSSQTSKLGKAMSSLRMIGSLVGSMLAYNFAHKLLVATGETIHAKSEMEGYFKMLNFGQGEVERFNNALDHTVQRFQRVNKYSLGETISSIGVEFNLTTDEMIKAMDVTSMITSEYLRAGRNANEASLAVKDVLQGQFQRLSRETGVKGEQLKEAGWNGDVTDVNSLLDALRKVGEDRNWDVFAEKANSINDVLTILQNRFGEWSADMVNTVQPTIVGVFNALMDVGGMFAQSMGGIWEWFNSGTWSASATQIGLVTGAILVLSQAFVMYRTQLGLVQASQLGLKGSIMSVIVGLNGQKIAEMGVRNSIMAKILGVRAETIAEGGLAKAIAERTAMTKYETIEEKLNTLSSEENTTAKKFNALQDKISNAEKKGLIATEEADTLRKELNTVATEANSIASLKQVGVNGGLTASFIALGGAENIAAVATGEVSVAMGVLNGVFALSPIGWLMGAVLALAGAFYVLTGGLDAHWDKMKTFNETLDNSDEIVKANNEHLKELADTLGTDSEEYKNASESVNTFNDKLNLSKKVVQEYNDELSILPTKLSEITMANSKGLGISDDGLKELSEYATGLDEGYSTYYRALQVLHKQQDDFAKSDRTMVQNMQDRGAEEKDILNKREQHMEHYNNFMKHSATHNTSDDWWEGSWNGILAGIDSVQLWLDYKTEDLANWWHDFNSDWEKIPQDLGNAWDNMVKSFPDLGKAFGDWVDDAKKSLDDSWKSLTEMWDNNIAKPLTDLFGGGSDFNGMMKIDTSWISNLVLGIVDSIKNFDWVGALSGFADTFGISNLVSAIFGTAEGMDTSWAWEWLNSNIITPLQTQFNMFLADPLSFMGGLVSVGGIGSLLTALLPSDGGVGIWDWVNNTIIVPMSSSIYNGIMSIPLVSDILALFGLVNGENSGASQKGTDIGNAFKTKVEEIVRNIPILGDVLQFLGVIPQANPTASSNGQGVGKSITDGVKNGMNNLGSMIIQEFNDALSGIGRLGEQAYSTAQSWANQLWEGVNSILQRASPGFFHDQFKAEFGTDIPNAIDSASTEAYTVGQNYATQIREGVSSVSTSVGFGGMVDSYEADAQIIADSSQLVGMTTTTAFNDMSLAVNQTTATMGTNVVSAYSTMQQKQSSSLNSMKTQNMTAYNEMYQKSNQSLIQMRDSTTNLTHQMTDAWTHMKNQIVATANRLKTDATVHFNTLSNTIGSFYRKIQNPSSWGSAGGSQRSTSRRNTRVGRAFSSAIKHGAGGVGGTGYTPNSTMTIASLKKKLCPNGECGDLFEGFGNTEIVNVSDFLSMISEGHGFGSWSGWNTTHYNHIKNKSDAWTMKSPTINLKGGIPTNANYKVGDFENGTPKISFSSFQSMAESIFSAIPYKFYYDSSWKGSWLGALQAGACNCWDGAHAILAFARTCGFDGDIVHGTWTDPDGTSYPHVWANINGKRMDTTGWQQRRSWSAGSPNIGASHQSNNQPPVNITVNVENAYGIDDLNSQIEEGIDRGLEKHFNKSYALGV